MGDMTYGPGAIFVGNMAGMLPVTMLVFAIVYKIRRPLARRPTLGSVLRWVGLFFCASVISGLINATFHGVLTTGLGMIPDPEMQNTAEVLTQGLLAWFASDLVMRTIGGRINTVTGVTQ